MSSPPRLAVTVPRIDQAARLRELAMATQRPTAPALRLAPVICICSGKGGVGKTMLAVNLSIVLSARGRSAVLIDADLGTGNADLVCGLSPARRLDRLRGEPGPRELESVAITGPGGMRLVPAIASDGWVAEFTGRECRRLLDSCAGMRPAPGVIVVDAGAGIGAGVMNFVDACDLALVVVTPEPTSMADAYALIKSAHLREEQSSPGRRASSPRRIGIIVNEARDGDEAQSVYTRISGCAARFLGHTPWFGGWVPIDPAVAGAVRSRRPVVVFNPASASANAIRTLAVGVESVVLPSDNRPKNGLGAAQFVRRFLFGGSARAS